VKKVADEYHLTMSNIDMRCRPLSFWYGRPPRCRAALLLAALLCVRSKPSSSLTRFAYASHRELEASAETLSEASGLSGEPGGELVTVDESAAQPPGRRQARTSERAVVDVSLRGDAGPECWTCSFWAYRLDPRYWRSWLVARRSKRSSVNCLLRLLR